MVGGLSALGAGLYSIGIPKDSVVKYETALKADKFLVLAHGTTEEVSKARDIMQTTHAVDVAVHMRRSTRNAPGLAADNPAMGSWEGRDDTEPVGMNVVL